MPEHEIVDLIEEIITHCKALQDYLQDDQAHFTANNIKEVQAGNEKKVELLIQIQKRIEKLVAALPHAEGNTLFSNLESYRHSLDQQSQNHFTQLMNNLKHEIIGAYQKLVINSNVITANLSHLKTVWDKLKTMHTDLEQVYDPKGQTGR